MPIKIAVLSTLLTLPIALAFGNPNEFLFDAINYDNLELVEALLKEGADPNLINEFDDTALMRACVCETGYKIAKLLISRGANVNAKNSYGVTALMYACEYGITDIVKLLIAKGARVNARTVEEYNNSGLYYPKNFTALSIAEKNGNKEIAKLLKNRGAVK